MANLKSKEKYSYRVSYAHEVGESFDPDMENMDEWLNDGHGTWLHPHIRHLLTPFF